MARRPTPIQSRAANAVHRENLIFTSQKGYDYCGELVFATEKPPYQYTLPVELKRTKLGWREPTGYTYHPETGLPRVTKRINELRLDLQSIRICQDDRGERK